MRFPRLEALVNGATYAARKACYDDAPTTYSHTHPGTSAFGAPMTSACGRVDPLTAAGVASIERAGTGVAGAALEGLADAIAAPAPTPLESIAALLPECAAAAVGTCGDAGGAVRSGAAAAGVAAGGGTGAVVVGVAAGAGSGAAGAGVATLTAAGAACAVAGWAGFFTTIPGGSDDAVFENLIVPNASSLNQLLGF